MLSGTQAPNILILSLEFFLFKPFIHRFHVALKFLDIFLSRQLFGFYSTFSKKPSNILIVFNVLILNS